MATIVEESFVVNVRVTYDPAETKGGYDKLCRGVINLALAGAQVDTQSVTVTQYRSKRKEVKTEEVE